jgi:hypothetical protein
LQSRLNAMSKKEKKDMKKFVQKQRALNKQNKKAKP